MLCKVADKDPKCCFITNHKPSLWKEKHGKNSKGTSITLITSCHAPQMKYELCALVTSAIPPVRHVLFYLLQICSCKILPYGKTMAHYYNRKNETH